MLAKVWCGMILFSFVLMKTNAGVGRTTLDLKDWLIIYASVDFGLICLAWICFAFYVCGADGYVLMLVYTCIMMLYILYTFAWKIVGIVILTRHSACVLQGTDLGIMTVIVLSFQVLSLLSTLFYKQLK